MARSVVVVIPTRYIAVLYVALIGSGLLLPLLVGRREHLEELVQTHCNLPGEWLPSISATTGDKTPERFLWRYNLVFGSGARILASFGVYMHYKAALPASNAVLINAMYGADWIRIFAAAGWTVVASNESWMSHSLFFAAYIIFGFVLQVSQFMLATRGKHLISHGERNVRLKRAFLIGQTVSAICNVALYARHSRLCSMYSHATVFEWAFAAFNVLFDLTNYYDLENEALTIGSGGNSALTSVPQSASTPPPLQSPISIHVNFAEAPCAALMWVCDIFFGYFFWSAIMHLIQVVYFMPMVAMETTVECATLLFVGSPMLIFVVPLTRRLLRAVEGIRIPFVMSSNDSLFRAPGYWWLHALALLSLFSVDVTRNPYLKIVVTSIGTLFLSYGYFLRVLSSNSTGDHQHQQPTVANASEGDSSASDSARQRLLYALPLGLVVSMSMRYMFISIDPLYADAFFNAVFGVAFGLLQLVTLYRHAVYASPCDSSSPSSITATGLNKDEGEAPHPTWTGAPEPLLGLCFGLATILSVALVTAYGVIPRMLGLDPSAGYGLLVICTFGLGLTYASSLSPAANALPSAIQRSPTLAAVLTYAPLRTGLLVVGFYTMHYATIQSNRVKELPHAHYPTTWMSSREHVNIKDWYAEEMWGSPSIAFAGGLMVLFGLGAAWPAVITFAVNGLRMKRQFSAAHASGSGRSGPISTVLGNSMFRSSFELWYFITFFVFVFGHVFVVDHPFIPGAWILRDSLGFVIGSNIVLLVLTLNYVSIRGSSVGQLPQPAAAAGLPRLPSLVAGSVAVLLLVCVVIRSAHEPGSNSAPAGNVIVAEHTDLVLKLANKLLDFQSQLNSFEDPNFSEIQRQTMTATTNFELAEFERDAAVTYGAEILAAAKNVAPVSGMIWTVHFGLDNFANDNLLRLVEMAKDTKADIIGLLESDSQRIINGNRDMVEVFTYMLGYEYSDWGPTTYDGTFGCALVSKYPIRRIRRYVLPSPLGELACLIHAVVDIYGIAVHVYVGHWGNTQHWADGILQSQFLGQVVNANPGPSMFLGYLVSKPDEEKYNMYAKEGTPGMLVDPAKELYRTRQWAKVQHHAKNPSGAEFSDPPYTDKDDANLADRDHNYQRPPSHAPVRYFFFQHVKRYSTAHPRWEFKDRYCQYVFYKTGADATESTRRGQVVDAAGKGLISGGEQGQAVSTVQFELLDWYRVLDIHDLSDTEIQVLQLRLVPAK